MRLLPFGVDIKQS